MLRSTYPHIPAPPTDALTRWLPQAFILLYLLLAAIWAFSTSATWDDDCPTRAFNALHAFSEPVQFISPWNRPLFILIFAIPVQLGFWTIPVLMSGIMAGSAWLLHRAVQRLGVPNAAFVLPLYLFQTFPFVISFNALTEPLAMALIAAGFWALVEKRWALFGILGGLLVLARLEMVLLLPIWAFLLVRARQFLPLLWLAIPFILWNMAGGILMGDWTYVFTQTIGNAGEESRYGSTPWLHYPERYIYVTGPVVFCLAFIGLAVRALGRRSNAFIDLQFAAGLGIYVWIGAMVAAGNSAGFLRNLIPVTPLAALLALEGLNAFIHTAEDRKQADPATRRELLAILLVVGTTLALSATVFNQALKMHTLFDETRSFWAHTFYVSLLAGLWLAWNTFAPRGDAGRATRVRLLAMAVVGLGISYTLLAEPPTANESEERQIMARMSALVQPELKGGAPLHVNHIWYHWVMGESPKSGKTLPVTRAALDAAPEGALVLWDLHYSPRLGGDVRHDYFDQHREWTELLRYRSVEDNFMAMLFRKGKAEKESALAMSEAYLNAHSELAAAWSGAGNARMRWGDMEGGENRLARATQIVPNDPDVWFSMGLAQMTQRKLPQAEHSLKKSRQLDPEFPSVWFHLGTVHAAMGQPQEAVNDLSQCIALKPDYANAYFARGTILARMDNIRGAMADFDATLKLEPGHVQARMNRGATYAMLRDHNRAIADLRVALKAEPDYADAWVFLGKSYAALGQLGAACESFRKALAQQHPGAGALIQTFCAGQ